MKAVRVTRFGLEHPMELEEVAEPKPGPGEMLVRIAAAGVNPLEVAIRSGNHPRAGAMTLPYTCGTDVAGEVEAIGDGVEAFAPGDRVWGRASTGAYAEKGLLAADSTGKLPDSTSFADGAALPIPLLTAWNALVVELLSNVVYGRLEFSGLPAGFLFVHPIDEPHVGDDVCQMTQAS